MCVRVCYKYSQVLTSVQAIGEKTALIGVKEAVMMLTRLNSSLSKSVLKEKIMGGRAAKTSKLDFRHVLVSSFSEYLA